jgi:alpha-D-xyloside xylohydrolase
MSVLSFRRLRILGLSILLALPLTGKETFKHTPTGFEVRCGETNIAVQAVGDAILRVIVAPGKTAPVAPRSWSVLPLRESPAVTMRSGKEFCEIRARSIQARLDLASGALTFLDNQGRRLFAEDPNEPRTFTPGTSGEEVVQHVQARFRLNAGEPLFGLGQQEDGILNRRGQKVQLIQNNRRMAIPFLASPAGWGLLWDNASDTEFADGTEGTTLWSDVGDAVVYYVIAGRDLDAVLDGLKLLTGPIPLLPRWAFGYWQSKERYGSQAELLQVVEEYRKKNLPIDGIILDWKYWGKYGWNAMRFDEEIFPDPAAMVKHIHALNLHLLVSVWPHVAPESDLGRELAAVDGLLPTQSWTKGLAYDAFNETAQDIYWKHLQKGLLGIGFDGLWLDATEPEANWADDSLIQKRHMVEVSKRCAAGSLARHLNAYPLLTTEGVARNWRAALPGQRPLMLTRSAFTGQGRTGSILWSGDIASNFPTLRRQIANGLNAALSGVPYWNTDIGGFFPAYYGGEYPRGYEEPGFRELYVRWFQVGAFHPMFRSHGTSTPREVWRFGEPGVPEYDALVRMLNLRYRLLPYLYTTAAQLRFGSGAFLRALAMNFSGDAAAAACQDQFLCGRSLMVSPVLEHQKVLASRIERILDKEAMVAPDGRPGMKMSLFAGDNPAGDPAKVSHEDRAEFNWNQQLPVGEYPAHFSFRLETTLKSRSGPQVLSVGSMGGVRVWLDDRKIVDDWTQHNFKAERVRVELARPTPLKVEFHGCDSTHLVLGLEEASQAEAPRLGRRLHLPAGSAWIDFWTGESFPGGQDIWREAGLDIVPLHVRAGSILPLGPGKSYALEKPEDPLELRIYSGADGQFALYEDDGESLKYEKGEYSLIPMTWDDSRRQLHIGARHGSFPGMFQKRTFHVVQVGPGHGVGESAEPAPDRIVAYTGQPLTIRLGRE